LIHDPDHLEDVLKVDAGEGQIGDDSADCARYGIKTRHAPRNKPQEVIDREEGDKISDPYARHFFLARKQRDREDQGVIVRPTFIDPWEDGR